MKIPYKIIIEIYKFKTLMICFKIKLSKKTARGPKQCIYTFDNKLIQCAQIF